MSFILSGSTVWAVSTAAKCKICFKSQLLATLCKNSFIIKLPGIEKVTAFPRKLKKTKQRRIRVSVYLEKAASGATCCSQTSAEDMSITTWTKGASKQTRRQRGKAQHQRTGAERKRPKNTKAVKLCLTSPHKQHCSIPEHALWIIPAYKQAGCNCHLISSPDLIEGSVSWFRLLGAPPGTAFVALRPDSKKTEKLVKRQWKFNIVQHCKT